MKNWLLFENWPIAMYSLHLFTGDKRYLNIDDSKLWADDVVEFFNNSGKIWFKSYVVHETPNKPAVPICVEAKDVDQNLWMGTSSMSDTLVFENESDAILFKLTWL